MFNTKHKQNKIINQNLQLFLVFCLCGIIYLGAKVNYFYFLLFVLMPFTIQKNKFVWQQWIICLSIILIFIMLTIFIPSFSVIDLVNKLNNKPRSLILRFIDKQYNEETASFIKLVLFNVKSEKSFILYNQIVNLGIVWLICISGFHVSLLAKIINKILSKYPKVSRYTTITIISFYSYLLNFSYGCLRVWLKVLLNPTFKKFEITKYNKIGLIGLVLCLLNPICFARIGFVLSFLICIQTLFISSLEINNKIINSLLINISAFAITVPYVIDINNKISLLTFINSFIFTYFSWFLFPYFLVFSWMPFMSIIHRGIIVSTYVLIGNISWSNIFVYSNPWPAWLKCLYYILWIMICKAVYLIVINNKI